MSGNRQSVGAMVKRAAFRTGRKQGFPGENLIHMFRTKRGIWKSGYCEAAFGDVIYVESRLPVFFDGILEI